MRCAVAPTAATGRPARTQAFLPENHHTTRRLFWTFWVQLAVVVAHIMVTGYTDPFISDNKQLLILLSL